MVVVVVVLMLVVFVSKLLCGKVVVEQNTKRNSTLRPFNENIDPNYKSQQQLKNCMKNFPLSIDRFSEESFFLFLFCIVIVCGERGRIRKEILGIEKEEEEVLIVFLFFVLYYYCLR